MTEKRFELRVNHNDQCDIVDWVESKEKNAICIYNDLGNYSFSSAKALCELLNELHEKNKELKQSNNDAWNLIQFIYNEIKEDGYMDWGRIQDLVEFEE